jgi:uncharacterized protein
VLLLDEQLQSISDLIEDEILLSLPIVPKHEVGTICADSVNSGNEAVEEIAEQAMPSAEEAATEDQVKENPFAVLAELKNRKD